MFSRALKTTHVKQCGVSVPSSFQPPVPQGRTAGRANTASPPCSASVNTVCSSTARWGWAYGGVAGKNMKSTEKYYTYFRQLKYTKQELPPPLYFYKTQVTQLDTSVPLAEAKLLWQHMARLRNNIPWHSAKFIGSSCVPC